MPGTYGISIRHPEQPEARSPIAEGVYTIGSAGGNKILLRGEDISSQHAILIIRDGKCVIEDLNSTNGTALGGSPVTGRVDIGLDTPLTIGDYTITLFDESAPPVSVPEPAPAPAVAPTPPGDPKAAPPESADESKRKAHIQIKQQIHKELLKRLDLKRMTMQGTQEDELQTQALQTITSIVTDVSERLPAGLKPDVLIKEVFDEAIHLGPLEDLLADESVTEIMVNSHDRIYIERNGKLVLSDKTFVTDASVLAIIERIVSPLGRRNRRITALRGCPS